MKSTTMLKACIAILLAPYVAATPVSLRSDDCVCVTDPCPCAGVGNTEPYVKERSAELPNCTVDPNGGCQDWNGYNPRSEEALSREWCVANKDECRVRLGIVIGSKRSAMMDPLEACLANWDLCTRIP